MTSSAQNWVELWSSTSMTSSYSARHGSCTCSMSEPFFKSFATINCKSKKINLTSDKVQFLTSDFWLILKASNQTQLVSKHYRIGHSLLQLVRSKALWEALIFIENSFCIFLKLPALSTSFQILLLLFYGQQKQLAISTS